MRRLVPALMLGLTVAFTGGCANFSDMEFTNPFATTSDINDVYYSKFSDIPIPTDMKGDVDNTLVSTTPNSVKIGLETFSGRVESSSLAAAMIHNMSRQGWVMRGQVAGKRSMQLYEKDQRFAIVYLYDSMMNTNMEVWVLHYLDGAPVMSGLPAAMPGIAPAANAPVWDDNFTPAGNVSEVWEGQSVQK